MTKNDKLHLLFISGDKNGELITASTNKPKIIIGGETQTICVGPNGDNGPIGFDSNANHECVSHLGTLLNDADEQTRNECLPYIVSDALSGIDFSDDGQTTFHFFGCFKMKSKKNTKKYILKRIGCLRNTVIDKDHITPLFASMLKNANLKQIGIDKSSIAYKLAAA